ncbi:glycoside hydrolase [Tothia fuscella]|uniref:alpha-1,2-Mannosidase n=1 Tax=Tothia fuscella TaxID=1048955 RepID=A0A9P4NWG1_9PEZI|nr:glycoside hydrolase [Tothia fuscella]
MDTGLDTGLEADTLFHDDPQSPVATPVPPPVPGQQKPPPPPSPGQQRDPPTGPAQQSRPPPTQSGGSGPLSPDEKRKPENKRRAEAVKAAFIHSWEPYRDFGLPDDELRPASREPYSTRNGWGASAIDALSTAIIMNLPGPVNEILQHVRGTDFSKSNTKTSVSLFETTIRYLGGLISGHDLLTEIDGRKRMVKDPNDIKVLVTKAKQLADRLSIAFNTTSGVPYNELNWEMNGPDKPLDYATTTNNLATVGTLILEWTRLSALTNNDRYKHLAHNAEMFLLLPTSWGATDGGKTKDIVEPFPGLVGFDIFIKNGTFKNGYGSWSGGADSFYEYLLKMWMYNASPSNLIFRDRWIKAVESSMRNVASHPITGVNNITLMQSWQADRRKGNFSQHLTCFDGGNILLGGQVLNRRDFIRFGRHLVDGCRHTYAATPTGIGPESFSWWSQDETSYKPPYFRTESSAYVLRPEVLESYYYAYRITGQTKYQDWAWEAFQAIEKYCRAEFGYSAINNVNIEAKAQDPEINKQLIRSNWRNEQESFWFAETLKYAYLIFADDDEEYQIPRGSGYSGLLLGRNRNKWVFNTEAHPIRVAGIPQ